MIYLKTNAPLNTIEDVLRKLFSYYRGGRIKNVETYSDEKCTQVECEAGKYRSADDIVDIVRTYIPSAEEREIFRNLLLMNIKRVGTIFHPFLVSCTDIRRPTFCFHSSGRLPSITNYLNADNLYRSRYVNWGNILEIAGFENIKEYLNTYREVN